MGRHTTKILTFDALVRSLTTVIILLKYHEISVKCYAISSTLSMVDTKKEGVVNSRRPSHGSWQAERCHFWESLNECSGLSVVLAPLGRASS